MDIHVVQYGENIETIANIYGISVEKLISDNGLINIYSLVVGQTLVILYPKITYTVKQGDTLVSIAESNGISLMELMRNNPFLYNRDNIYEGDTLVIQYNTVKDIQVNSYANTFISDEILARSLPYLTFLSIYNYQVNNSNSNSSKINTFGDDTKIIQMAKDYSTVPLLMISALSPTGESDISFLYEILLDTELQDQILDEILEIIRLKGYMGVNMLISHITAYNQRLYLNIFEKMSSKLRDGGYIYMITLSTDASILENLDLQSISYLVDRIIFLQNIWTKQMEPPGPVSNISLIRPFVDNLIQYVSPDIISLGKPLIGYDWIIPFVEGSKASLLSLNSTLFLAYEQGVVINFDEVSQTPFFNYYSPTVGASEEHQVWFIDARSIRALDDLIIEYDLMGTGIWNITSYNQQLFSITNGTYNIVKLLDQ